MKTENLTLSYYVNFRYTFRPNIIKVCLFVRKPGAEVILLIRI